MADKTPIDQHESQLKLVSIGIAAANKQLHSNVLAVYPQELNPYATGEINSDTAVLTHQGVDADGKPYTVSVTASNSIRAKWLPRGSNRITPPDVRRGERVELYKYGDADQYWWVATGLDDDLRRLETVTYGFNASADEQDATRTPDNSYLLQVSTHDGHVTLSTSQANGEAAAFVIQVNAKAGFVAITDKSSPGNKFVLDSVNRRIFAANADGTVFDMNKSNLAITVPDTFSLDAKNIKLTATANMLLNAATMSLTATGTFATKAASMAINATGAYALIAATQTVQAVTTFASNVTFLLAMLSGGKDVGSNHTHTTTSPGEPTSDVNG